MFLDRQSSASWRDGEAEPGQRLQSGPVRVNNSDKEHRVSTVGHDGRRGATLLTEQRCIISCCVI
jgi:hypothetical protein